jgi:hypothetical protein
MRQLQIEVLSVSAPEFVKTVKGGYNVIEVAYKADGKVTGKKLLDFANKDSYNLMAKAKAGEVYDITTEKNEKGYLDWVGVVPAVALPEVPGGGETAVRTEVSPTKKYGGRVIGNTYETPEERLVKQAAIIRQATLNAAVEFGAGDEEAVLKTARRFETYVYTDLQARAESLRTVVEQLKFTS